MWKKLGNLGKILRTNGFWRGQSEPQAGINSYMNVESTPSSRVWALADTTVARKDGGWEDTGANAPNASQFLRRHHILANAFINTVQMSLCYETPQHSGCPVTLRVPKAVNPSAGLFHSSRANHGFFHSLLLISRSENKGQNKLGKDLISHLRCFWVSSRQSCGLLFPVFRSLGAHTANILCALATPCLTQAVARNAGETEWHWPLSASGLN